MSDASLEQRVAALEAKVAAVEEHIRLNLARKGIFRLRDGPPLTPEELAIHEEVQGYIREAREADLAELDREMERERRIKLKEENRLF